MAANNARTSRHNILLTFFVGISVALSTSSFAEQQTIADNTDSDFVEENKKTYGPIQSSDTLWKIAVAHRPDTSVSNYQVMMALFKTNPNAFLRDDINTMVEGQYLRIPTIEQIREIPPFPYGKSEADQQQALESVAEQDQINVADNGSEDAADIEIASTESVSVENSEVEQEVIVAEVSSDVEVTELEQENSQPQVAVAEAAVQENTYTELQQENNELKESLSSVDDQLSYLQYEVAKANEMQLKLDEQLEQQNKLLQQAKLREQRLLAQQKKLSEQGLLANPIAYWSVNAILAILVIVLFVKVSRRKAAEQASQKNTTTSKESAANESKKSDKNKNTNKDEAVSLSNESVPLITDDVSKTEADVVAESKPDITDVAEVQPVEQSQVKSEIRAETDAQQDNTQIVDPKTESFTIDENPNVSSAFSSMDFTPVEEDSSLLDEKALLDNLVADLEKQQKEQREQDNKEVEIQANADDLDIDQIIDGMLEDESRPRKLRSAKSEPDNEDSKVEENFVNEEFVDEEFASETIPEINDYDDVEFDKLLAEISTQSEPETDTNSKPTAKASSNVTPLRPQKKAVEKEITQQENKDTSEEQVSAENVNTATASDDKDSASDAANTAKSSDKKSDEFIEIDELIEEYSVHEEESEVYKADSIDVGLNEFPEFANNVNHVNVDDDKHGVKAKLDLAQVYIEIGDLDNAAVILKNVMKLGNSAQQQQAQDLLYSMK
ncbi:FimV/HubP family polar landmark protein [Thalassotalea crassostreae]|uniref:FimV/HubP family polar landmark protein n=1 Tax=Thalassotalea crassostreae TaxID=1763536 RepID=UPI00083801F8|nr:FimV/HubP family polar landmark protein [Thalassotalea crassostreae]